MPRSPSRDRSDRYTGNRGYFHIPEPVRRWKGLLALAAGVAVIMWVGLESLAPTRAAPAHTHGPVANPHAPWENDCTACHRSHGIAEIDLVSPFQARDRWHDLTCERCHSGPPHHDTLTPEATAFHDRCSNCHHDHGGRLNSLVRIADRHCTHCHADLPKHTAGTPKCEAKITAFAEDHPEFRALKPGYPVNRTLKFSHAVHMTPGQRYAPGGKPFTRADLERLADKDTATRYAADASGAITLDCASCHHLDSGISGKTPTPQPQLAGEPQAAVRPPRAAGAYFLPVNYEAHCKACHPVTAPDPGSGAAAQSFPVPHRRQPHEIRDFLMGEYSRRLAEAGAGPPLQAVPGPAGRLDIPEPTAAGTFRATVTDRTDRALDLLMKGSERDPAGHAITGSACGKCHVTTDTDKPLSRRTIAPVANRTIWLPAGRFDHTSHRTVSCADCHGGTAGSYAPNGTPVEFEPPQIPGVKSCVACHSPPGTEVTLPDGAKLRGGGIRHGCTDCHIYHNGDHPLQGRGAPARFPTNTLSLREFLLGREE